MRLPHLEPRGVVARDLLHGGERITSRDLDLTHVADVEQAGAGSHRHVLLGDPRVFERHLPSAERDHFRAGSAVAGVERGLFERGRGRLFHVGLRCAAERQRYYGRSNAVKNERRRSGAPPLRSIACLRVF